MANIYKNEMFALANTGANNTTVGAFTLQEASTVSNCSIFGNYAGNKNTGNDNIFFGVF